MNPDLAGYLGFVALILAAALLVWLSDWIRGVRATFLALHCGGFGHSKWKSLMLAVRANATARR